MVCPFSGFSMMIQCFPTVFDFFYGSVVLLAFSRADCMVFLHYARPGFGNFFEDPCLSPVFHYSLSIEVSKPFFPKNSFVL